MRKEITGLIFLACALVACKNDVYDPNYNSNLGARVPDGFTWSTTQKLNVNVEVKDEYNGKYYYAVRVYDKAPTEGVLPVAASDKVNKDMPFSQEIVVPATVNKLYIHQVFKNADASEVITKKEVAISEGSASCSFGNGGTTRMATTRADENELKEGIAIEEGNNYYLNGKYTIKTISDKVKNVTIKVNEGGELNFSESVTLPNSWTIQIEHKGKLTAKEGTNITFDSNSDLYNYGEVRVYDITFINGATLYNGEAMNEKDAGACFYAHDITLVNGHGGDKRYLGERSFTSCNKLILNNVKLTFKTSAWLKCEELDTQKDNGQGASTLLGEGSLVGNSKYTGLAMIGEIEGALTIENTVLVECKDVDGKIKGEVVSDAKGLITIIGTTCNEGGFGNNETVELGKFTYIIEDMYPQDGDYDMNDIVVSMTATQKGSDLTITGELKAVGASYAITPYIKVNNEVQPLFTKDGQALEAHAALNASTSSLINTEKGSTHYPAQPFTLKYSNIQEALSMDNIDFYIVVNNNEVHWNTSDESQKATWGMRIPGLNFKWAQERVKITEAYLEFGNWFDNSSYPWYNGKTNSDKIYNGN